jgi:hypothetical protein
MTILGSPPARRGFPMGLIGSQGYFSLDDSLLAPGLDQERIPLLNWLFYDGVMTATPLTGLLRVH